MYNTENDCIDKLAASQQAQQATTCDNSAGSLRGNSPMREGLLGRIRNRRNRAENESMKANRLYELEALLEKNQETARILELMEEVGR